MISEQQISIIINTLKPFKPSKIGIFGSYARGENTDESDIDILYSFNSIYSLFDLIGLQNELQNKLSKEIDLVEFNSIHPKLKDRILTDAKIVYEE
ncbi:MAG: nucleotidyltransferase [Flavobacterium sp. BFFFF2]|nr:MAG: nucleotidyltransferase [Flavobacterium sp. BFFFF2]